MPNHNKKNMVMKTKVRSRKIDKKYLISLLKAICYTYDAELKEQKYIPTSLRKDILNQERNRPPANGFKEVPVIASKKLKRRLLSVSKRTKQSILFRMDFSKEDKSILSYVVNFLLIFFSGNIMYSGYFSGEANNPSEANELAQLTDLPSEVNTQCWNFDFFEVKRLNLLEVYETQPWLIRPLCERFGFKKVLQYVECVRHELPLLQVGNKEYPKRLKHLLLKTAFFLKDHVSLIMKYL